MTRPRCLPMVALLTFAIGCTPANPNKSDDSRESPLSVRSVEPAPAIAKKADDDLRRYFPNKEGTVRKYVCSGFGEETYTVKSRRENGEELILNIEVTSDGKPYSTLSYCISPTVATLVSFDGKQHNPPSVVLKNINNGGEKSWTERRGSSREKYTLLENKEFTVNNVVYNCVGVECLITEANIGLTIKNWYARDVGLVAFEENIQGGSIKYVMDKP